MQGGRSGGGGTVIFRFDLRVGEEQSCWGGVGEGEEARLQLPANSRSGCGSKRRSAREARRGGGAANSTPGSQFSEASGQEESLRGQGGPARALALISAWGVSPLLRALGTKLETPKRWRLRG